MGLADSLGRGGGRGRGDGALPGCDVGEWGAGRGGVSLWDPGCKRSGLFPDRPDCGVRGGA